MDQSICTSLPHTHYDWWYEVGMLRNLGFKISTVFVKEPIQSLLSFQGVRYRLQCVEELSLNHFFVDNFLVQHEFSRDVDGLSPQSRVYDGFLPITFSKDRGEIYS